RTRWPRRQRSPCSCPVGPDRKSPGDTGDEDRHWPGGWPPPAEGRRTSGPGGRAGRGATSTAGLCGAWLVLSWLGFILQGVIWHGRAVTIPRPRTVSEAPLGNGGGLGSSAGPAPS